MLRDYQQYAVDETFKYLYNSTGHPVIAMPTGTGKSHVISGISQKAISIYGQTRILMLTHVHELISQNYNKLREAWPMAPAGIYSAGLNRRDMHSQIIFGGVASVIKALEDLLEYGIFHILLIDECHLLSPNADTMYQKIVDRLKEKNPHLRVIGLSATPYRLGQGMITDGGVFTDIPVDMTHLDTFNWFIDQAYMTTLIPKPTGVEIDVSNIGMSNGDFTQSGLELEVDRVLYDALYDTVQKGHNRRSWLVFVSGTRTTERAAHMLSSWGISAVAINKDTPKAVREEAIKAHKAGTLRALVSNNILTTGFDNPMVDLIAMLRATVSPGLWVQMLGRGTRPFYAPGFTHQQLEDLATRRYALEQGGKWNCLVLDYAGNVPRLGPINDPVIPKRRGGGGDAPIKLCQSDKLIAVNGVAPPGCGAYNHTSARHCCDCHAAFDFSVTFTRRAHEHELISTQTPVFEVFEVHTVVYRLHEKAGSPPMLRVVYRTPFQEFTEMLFFEHKGFAAKKSRDWWRARYKGEPPETTAEALEMAQKGWLRTPRQIRVWVNKQYPEVVGYEYE